MTFRLLFALLIAGGMGVSGHVARGGPPTREQPRLDERRVPLSGEAESYLSKHKLYVSVTTSPDRIVQLARVLRRLDLSHVERVYVNLPETFERTGKKYEIPVGLLQMPKVVINRVPEDLGPITKILPTAELLQKEDPDAWIISIDDDQRYAFRLVNDLVNAKAKEPHTVFASTGNLSHKWGVPMGDFPGHRQNLEESSGQNGVPADLIEGFAGIIYRAGDLDVDRLRTLSALSPTTRVSDDLVISYHLGERGIQKQRLFGSGRMGFRAISFDFGLRPDALQFGAGLTDGPTSHRIDREKYQRAFWELRRYSKRSCLEEVGAAIIE